MVFVRFGHLKMKYVSVRQSDKWAKYLNFLGWRVLKTKKGTKVGIFKTFLGYVAKIQRPQIFDKKELKNIEQLCQKYNALFIKIEPMVDQDISILKESGYIDSNFPLSPTTTLVIDLEKTKEDLWKDLSSSCKYSIRRAYREGSNVACIQNPTEKDLTDFYRLAKETSKYFKFYIPPLNDLLEKRKVFGDECFLVNVYNKDGKYLSGKFFISNEKIVTYILGGTAKDGRRGKWGYALQWEALLYFKRIGYKAMDLEGLEDPRFKMFTKDWGGFSYFKEKFGGTKLIFPLPQIKYLSPIFKLLSQFVEVPL